MEDTFLTQLEKLYEEKDLLALDALASPAFRSINKKEDYRSVLMLSCNNIKHLSKIASVEADAIILNLEDGVSKREKPFALVLCAIFLSHYKKCDKKLIVRVNALDEGGYDEIAYLNQFMPDAVRVPKIKTPQEVKSILDLLNQETELHLSIETALAWANLDKLRIDKRVKTFYLGILDLFADMGLPQALITKENPTVLYMLSHFLITTKAQGIKPVSFVYQEYKNNEEFSVWVALEKQLGFMAKGCITPAQCEIVNRSFINKEEEIKRAQIIVKLFLMHEAEGITGFVDEEYGFIDEPIYKGALALLEK
ncbi:MAG: aldolase/citrate lyase family protein [Sulfurimonadaceae bacterium]|jgi:citrate lyase subunit beta/citryl-CoA lyase|nr:aldolase/citrate lyase family protein [Sulfurimonadaceae bacterium]